MKKGRRPPARRTPVAPITKRAIDLFDAMESLKPWCDEWCEHNDALHRELKLKPWQWPAYDNCEDTNKTGVLGNYRLLKATSDARKRT